MMLVIYPPDIKSKVCQPSLVPINVNFHHHRCWWSGGGELCLLQVLITSIDFSTLIFKVNFKFRKALCFYTDALVWLFSCGVLTQVFQQMYVHFVLKMLLQLNM